MTDTTTTELYPRTTHALSHGEWVPAPTVYVVLHGHAYCFAEDRGVALYAAPLSSQHTVRWDLLAPADNDSATTQAAAAALDALVFGSQL
jgi:hypothetical protein